MYTWAPHRHFPKLTVHLITREVNLSDFLLVTKCIHRWPSILSAGIRIVAVESCEFGGGGYIWRMLQYNPLSLSIRRLAAHLFIYLAYVNYRAEVMNPN